MSTRHVISPADGGGVHVEREPLTVLTPEQEDRLRAIAREEVAVSTDAQIRLDCLKIATLRDPRGHRDLRALADILVEYVRTGRRSPLPVGPAE